MRKRAQLTWTVGHFKLLRSGGPQSWLCPHLHRREKLMEGKPKGEEFGRTTRERKAPRCALTSRSREPSFRPAVPVPARKKKQQKKNSRSLLRGARATHDGVPRCPRGGALAPSEPACTRGPSMVSLKGSSLAAVCARGRI